MTLGAHFDFWGGGGLGLRRLLNDRLYVLSCMTCVDITDRRGQWFDIGGAYSLGGAIPCDEACFHRT